MPHPVDITGEKFGRLTAVEVCGKQKREMVWLCRCECGLEVRVRVGNLRSGNTQSCGCLKGVASK